MFSGIVECSANVLKIQKSDDQSQGLRVQIVRPFIFDDLSVGDSIAVNGVCLTIEEVSPEIISFFIGPESLRLTSLSQLQQGEFVNLERSIRYGDRVHGHFVTGHVDGKAKVLRAEILGESLLLTIQLPTDLKRHIWKKGSVAINGVSLTVNELQYDQLTVCLIPETLRRTNLAQLKSNDIVNIEVDMLARALVRMGEGQNELR